MKGKAARDQTSICPTNQSKRGCRTGKCIPGYRSYCHDRSSQRSNSWGRNSRSHCRSPLLRNRRSGRSDSRRGNRRSNRSSRWGGNAPASYWKLGRRRAGSTGRLGSRICVRSGHGSYHRRSYIKCLLYRRNCCTDCRRCQSNRRDPGRGYRSFLE